MVRATLKFSITVLAIALVWLIGDSFVSQVRESGYTNPWELLTMEAVFGAILVFVAVTLDVKDAP